MVTKDEVRAGIQRLVGMWPALGKRDALRQEIGHAVMKHAERIEPADIRAGLDKLIASTRTGQDDGGPAQPPSPHEVVGCILAASNVRRMADGANSRPRNDGITFAEWWETVPDDERPQHAALHMMMTEPDKARAMVDKARKRHGLRRMGARA